MSSLFTELFINGEYRAASSGSVTSLINPATEEILTEVSAASSKDVDLAITSANDVFESSWRDLTPGKRANILYAIAGEIRKNRDELANLESINIGKPISDALDEIELGARVFEYYAGAISKFTGETIPVARGGLNFTLNQPMGVVAAIIPWNFPFPITCWKVAPALAAGNAVIAKPASLSPLTAIRLGGLAKTAGLPSGVLQILAGSGRVAGEAILKHPLIRKISFTGSTEVGAHIMATAAQGIKRVSLELGGKSPNIVFKDADIEAAANQSPMSVFANTGQDCCARSRMFVEESVFDQFVECFVKSTKALRVDDPSLTATQIGPMVCEQQRSISENFLEDCKKQGRTILTGGERPKDKGYYITPSVVVGAETTDRVWQEEVFGPVVCIRPFKDEVEMLREVNDTPYGLSGSIWTNDLKRALRVARRVDSGVVSINTHSSVHVEAPFGGFKQSGIGRDLGMKALEGYTELKNIYVEE